MLFLQNKTPIFFFCLINCKFFFKIIADKFFFLNFGSIINVSKSKNFFLHKNFFFFTKKKIYTS